MELIDAEVSGLEVILDALRFDDEDHIWLLSMAGQNTAVRGAWASLLQGSFLAIPSTGQRLSLQTTTGWTSKSSRVGDPRRLGRAFAHLILTPPCTDPWCDSEEILVVEHATSKRETTLMRSLTNRSSIPLDTSWGADIWRWAERNGSITELRGHGPNAWLARIQDKQLLDEFLPRFKRP